MGEAGAVTQAGGPVIIKDVGKGGTLDGDICPSVRLLVRLTAPLVCEAGAAMNATFPCARSHFSAIRAAACAARSTKVREGDVGGM